MCPNDGCLPRTPQLSLGYAAVLRDYVPAWMTCLGIGSMLYQRLPSQFSSGEMWAEAATNYFWHAHNDGFLTNLFTLDAGYVPLAVRLAALLVHAMGVSPQLTPYVYQAWTLAFLTVCMSYLALPRWREWIPSDLARVLICVAIACHPDYDLRTFINFSYWAAIPLLLHLASLLNAELVAAETPCCRRVPMWRVIGFSAFVGVFCISKPHFIAFAPALGLLFCVGLWRHRLKLAVPAFVGLGAIALQMLVLIHSKAKAVAGPKAAAFDLVRWLGELTLAIPALNLGGKAAWVPRLAAHPMSTWMAVFGLVGAGLIVYELRRGDKKSLICFAVVCVSTFGAGLALSVAAFAPVYGPTWDTHNLESIALRWFFVPCVAAFLCLAVIVARHRYNQPVPWLLAAWLLACFPFGFGALPRDKSWPEVGFSSWQQLAPKVFESGVGCIPVDPLGFMYQQNCEQLVTVAAAEAVAGFAQLPVEMTLPVPEGANAWSVDGISVLIDRAPPYDVEKDLFAITAKALQSDGQVLATAPSQSRHGSMMVSFAFHPPITGVVAITFVSEKADVLRLLSRDLKVLAPLWMWYGRRDPAATMAKG